MSNYAEDTHAAQTRKACANNSAAQISKPAHWMPARSGRSESPPSGALASNAAAKRPGRLVAGATPTCPNQRRDGNTAFGAGPQTIRRAGAQNKARHRRDLSICTLIVMRSF
jgi:hypothetical protein